MRHCVRCGRSDGGFKGDNVTCSRCMERTAVRRIERGERKYRIGDVLTLTCKICGNEFEWVAKASRHPTVCGKECERERNRQYVRNTRAKKQREGYWNCETCEHQPYCNAIVHTILPLVCQVELTSEQERVLEVLDVQQGDIRERAGG